MLKSLGYIRPVKGKKGLKGAFFLSSQSLMIAFFFGAGGMGEDTGAGVLQ
jgi:hypothetical protein